MMQEMATEVGVAPNIPLLLLTDPKVALKLIFGPLFPYQFRMSGAHAHPRARQWFLNAYDDTVFSTMTRRVKLSAQKGQGRCFLLSFLFVTVALILYHWA